MVPLVSSLAKQTRPTIQSMGTLHGIPIPQAFENNGQPGVFTKHSIFASVPYAPSSKSMVRSMWGSTLAVGGQIDLKV